MYPSFLVILLFTKLLSIIEFQKLGFLSIPNESITNFKISKSTCSSTNSFLYYCSFTNYNFSDENKDPPLKLEFFNIGGYMFSFEN